MSDVKRLLDEASPLPWADGGYQGVHDEIYGCDLSGAGGACITLGGGREGGEGSMAHGDAALIVHAVNHLPDYEAAADALEGLLTHAVPHLRGETSPAAMQSDPRLWSSVQKGRAALRRLRGKPDA